MLQISVYNGILCLEKFHQLYLSILQGNTPFSDWLSQNCPCTEIQASGLSVGLPEGIMENSEVGHQNIGVGKVLDRPILRWLIAFRYESLV